MADLKGKITGDKRVIKAINVMPKDFIRNLGAWLYNEKGRFLGDKGYKGKKFKSGYKISLRKKRLKRREGTWAKQVAGLFSGKISTAKRVNDLSLTMGVLGRKHQLKRAMELLSTGGTITSSSEMPIPMYKNLAALNYRGPFSGGNVNSGLKSKAFAKFADAGKLTALKKEGKTYYFNKEAKKNNRGRFSRSDLLFIGVHGITVRKTLTARFDFEAQFNKKKARMIDRGQKAIDRAVKQVERKLSR